jgi:D-alanyl-D-alanine dipeptidase
MMHRVARIVVCCIAIASASGVAAQSPKSATPPEVLTRSEQIVVVTTSGWDSLTGTLRRFQRASTTTPWRAVGSPVPIVVGRTGLAWGVGFDDLGRSLDAAAPHKYEGDGRSPAGVFPLDTLFGFAPRDSTPWAHLPYSQLLPSSDCVDDTASAHYNTVVRRDDVPRIDWSSSEHMRTVGQYRIGAIVSYNAAPPVKGRGSCIFLHIWNGPSSTTSGCTALDADQLLTVDTWLEERRRPALVQLPAREYERLRKQWALP